MTVKQEFCNFLQSLMDASPQITAEISDNLKAYVDILLNEDEENKSEITDNGKQILKYMQDNDSPTYKARDIAEGLDVLSRKVSGSMRKLVTDGFVEKVGKDPAVYILTDKGKNFAIE